MIRNWLRNFMIGRYGPDQLGIATLLFSAFLNMVSFIAGWGLLMLAAYLIMVLTLFRMLSRNIVKRRAENDRFLRIWWPLKMRLKRRLGQFRDRKKYRFFKCPSCKNRLRVPKGKGKIRVTCPKCGERFEKKT